MSDETLDPDVQCSDGTLYLAQDPGDSCVRCGGSARANDGLDVEGAGRICTGCSEIERRKDLQASGDYRILELEDPKLARLASSDPRLTELLAKRLAVQRLQQPRGPIAGKRAQVLLALRAAREHRSRLGELLRRRP